MLDIFKQKQEAPGPNRAERRGKKVRMRARQVHPTPAECRAYLAYKAQQHEKQKAKLNPFTPKTGKLSS